MELHILGYNSTITVASGNPKPLTVYDTLTLAPRHVTQQQQQQHNYRAKTENVLITMHHKMHHICHFVMLKMSS